MRRILAHVLMFGLVACTTESLGISSVALRPIPGRALSGTEGQSLIVTPVLFIRHTDEMGWAKNMDKPRDYERHTDTLIQTSLEQRAPRVKWVFPETILKQRARNGGYVTDPYSISGAQLLPGVWKPGQPIQEPLAGELRSMVSFQETARYVLVPVEIHFVASRMPGDTTKGPAPLGRAILRIVLYDARATVVLWAGDVIGDPVVGPEEAMPSIARQLGDILGSA